MSQSGHGRRQSTKAWGRKFLAELATTVDQAWTASVLTGRLVLDLARWMRDGAKTEDFPSSVQAQLEAQDKVREDEATKEEVQ